MSCQTQTTSCNVLTGQLDDQGAVKDVLEVLAEQEGNHVSQMHAVGGRSTSCVKVEGLLLLISIQDPVQFSIVDNKKIGQDARS